jgi:hypothetical protein
VILSCCVSAEVTDAGGDERSGSLGSFVDLEGRVGKDHPLRIIRGVVNEALVALSGEFSALYSRSGRPSIPPEKLVAAASETPAQHGSFLGRRSTGSQARTPRERRAHTQSAGRAVQMARKNPPFADDFVRLPRGCGHLRCHVGKSDRRPKGVVG